MAEPRLRIVDELFAETPLPPDATEQQRKRREIDMATVARYVPAITKRARAQREAEILQEAGARTLADLSMLEAIKAEHRNEIHAMHLANDQHAERIEQTTRHRVGAVRNGWAAIGILIGAPLGALLMFIAVDAGQKAAFDSASEFGSRMVTSGAALQGAIGPQERDVPHCDTLPCDAVENAR